MGCYSLLKRQEHAHDDAIWTVCWASHNTLVTGSLDTTAKVWTVQSQGGEVKLTEERVFDGFALGVISADVAPQSSLCAIGAMDSKIRLFDLSEQIETCELKTIDAGPVDSWKVKFSPCGKLIATGGISGKINLFTTGPGDTVTTQLDVGKFAYSVDFVSIADICHLIVPLRVRGNNNRVITPTESRWQAAGRRQRCRCRQCVRFGDPKEDHATREPLFARQIRRLLT